MTELRGWRLLEVCTPSLPPSQNNIFTAHFTLNIAGSVGGGLTAASFRASAGVAQVLTGSIASAVNGQIAQSTSYGSTAAIITDVADAGDRRQRRAQAGSGGGTVLVDLSVSVALTDPTVQQRYDVMATVRHIARQ